jgi:hypothetical protein
MIQLVNIGRTFFSVAIIAMAAQQFFFPGLRPVFVPESPSWVPSILVYLHSVLLIVFAAFVLLHKKGRFFSLLLGAVLVLSFLLFHLPYQLINHPESLGSWTNALKELALGGGAFVIAGSFPVEEESLETNPILKLLEKLIPFGRILFSITMITFGIDHLLYTEFVATLVPTWIPGSIFWTYFAAFALAAAGWAIIIKVQVKPAAFLLGLMIFLWFLVLHIPRAIADPLGSNGNEITSVFQALGFSGIGFLLAGLPAFSEVFGIKRPASLYHLDVTGKVSKL